jgi:hypothetical protein
MRTCILGFCISCIMIMAVAMDLSDMGCKPAQVSIDIDLINAECALLEQQPESPAVAIIACEVFDVAQQIVQQFNVHMPADQAAAFLAAHPIKAGHPLPAGVNK